MPPLGAIDKLSFPLVRVNNVAVERSQVWLHLPETYRYFQFGGTMSPVVEDDMAAGRLAYDRNQTERLLDTVRQGDPFARSLAANNLKQLAQAVQVHLDTTAPLRKDPARKQPATRRVIHEAEAEVQKVEQTPAGTKITDNRKRMAKLVQEQHAERAQNAVQDHGRELGFPDRPARPGVARRPAQPEAANPRPIRRRGTQSPVAPDQPTRKRRGRGRL